MGNEFDGEIEIPFCSKKVINKIVEIRIQFIVQTAGLELRKFLKLIPLVIVCVFKSGIKYK